MGRFGVALISVAIYAAIFFVIGLLSPPKDDNIRKLQTSISANLTALSSSEYFRYVPISNIKVRDDLVQQNSLEKGEVPQISTHNFKGFVNRVRKDKFRWNFTDNQNNFQKLQKENGHNTYLQVIEDEFPCYQQQFTRNSKIWKQIESQICMQDEQNCNQSTYFRVFDGLFSHFQLQQISKNLDSKKQYGIEVFNSSEKANNLMFIYETLARSVQLLLPPGNITVYSQNITGDLLIVSKLSSLKINLDDFSLKSYKKYFKFGTKLQILSNKFQFVGKLFQSQLSSECSILIDHQLKGFLASLKIAFFRDQISNAQEFISILGLFNSVSKSLGIFYSNNIVIVELQHLSSAIEPVKFYYFILGVGLVTVYLFLQIDIKKKVKNQYRHAFPPSKRIKQN